MQYKYYVDVLVIRAISTKTIFVTTYLDLHKLKLLENILKFKILLFIYVLFFSFTVCIGTNGRMSVPSNRDHHYRNLRDRFTNCTYVDGNLELTWLQDPSLDLSFVQHIREVTGYVLISHVDIQHIVLPR